MTREPWVPKVGTIYRHYKGNTYIVTTHAQDDEGRWCAVYSGVDGGTYVQTVDRFTQTVDHEGGKVSRFEPSGL